MSSGVTRFEKHLVQFNVAQDIAQLGESKEWNQKGGYDRHKGEYALQGTAANSGYARGERLTVIQTDESFLKYFETTQNDGEGNGLEYSRVDERFLFEMVRKMKLLGDQHDLAKGQGVEQRHSVRDKRNMLLGQKDRLVDD
jgi:hypothetical protein